MSKRFVYFQPNSKDRKNRCGDCVIRAIAGATGQSWREVFLGLAPYALEKQDMPNSRECYEAYLRDHGFAYHGFRTRKGERRPTVKKFAKTHKEGTYIAFVKNHVVCIRDGKYYDTWDSGDRCLYGYFEHVG